MRSAIKQTIVRGIAIITDTQTQVSKIITDHDRPNGITLKIHNMIEVIVIEGKQIEVDHFPLGITIMDQLGTVVEVETDCNFQTKAMIPTLRETPTIEEDKIQKTSDGADIKNK